MIAATIKDDSSSPRGAPTHSSHSGEIVELTIPREMFTVVSSFLAPREMLRLASTNKSMVDNIAYTDIAHNAVVAGHDLTHFLKVGIQEQSVHMPTKLRFIRLLNAHSCEVCVSRPYYKNWLYHCGLRLCEGCGKELFPSVNPWTRGVKELMLTERRINADLCASDMLARDTIRSKRGEPCGPILTLQALEYICENEITVDEYIGSLNTAPSPQMGLALLATMSSAIEQLARRNQDSAERSQEKTRQTAILDSVLLAVDEQWKGYVSFEFHPPEYRPVFKCGFVESLLRPLMNDIGESVLLPEDIRRYRSQVAALVNGSFQRLTDYGFLDYSFLSRSQPFEDLVHEHLERTVSVNEILSSRLFRTQNGRLIKYRELCFEILVLATFWIPPRTCFFNPSMKPYKETFLPPGFIEFVANSIGKEMIEGVDERNSRRFAKRVCQSVYLRQLHIDDKKRGKFRDHCHNFYRVCQEYFQLLVPLVIEYVGDHRTVDFVVARDKVNNEDAWVEVKANVVNSIWSVKQAGPLKQIERMEFDSLRGLHQSIAENIWKDTFDGQQQDRDMS